MKEKIKESIDDPRKLEMLYRNDRKSFESGFEKIYPEIQNTEAAKFWKSRLDFEKQPDKTRVIFSTDFFIMIAICLFAGFLIKIPDIFKFYATSFHYYERETGIIVFLGLTLYAVANNKYFSRKNVLITLLIFTISAIYISFLPYTPNSASVKLVFIHMPILMWCLYGLAFIDFDLKDLAKRIDYIKHNGDLAIIGALIIIAGGALMAVTVMLFQSIGIHVEKFYTNYIVQIGFVSAPVVAAFILKNFATLANKIAPIIANLFSPLVTITLIIYLIAIAVTGKDPYNDRDFLLTFNLMLIGVMAIIVFSVSEGSLIRYHKFNELILFILSIVTLIINLIALSAIFYRLSEYGFTPNRTVVLGSNILIFANLILITLDLFKVNFKKSGLEKVELTISGYLPFYIIWIIFVVFVIPFVFGMR
jgi:hypothetical protein